MEQVVVAVRSAVDTGVMKPGVKYSVYQLADQLGVSRTPVRDALLRLEEAGLIRFEARQGFYILFPHPREIADIFAIRLALELPAVRRAAVVCTAETAKMLTTRMQLMHDAIERSDEKAFAAHDTLLHDHILEAADNARARKIVATLRESTRLLGASTAERTRTLSDIENEHTPIIDAISRKDPDAAEAAMRSHLVSTGRLLVAQAALDQQLAELDVEEVCARIEIS
ncbi:GntR family transcriptional regulator [Rhodococcus fascians]|nr:GntR family transcriptional regulator [Rhodococcus fascians]MBY4237914.1 GntR family transcriptional regulator [Rhodococcus fascians]MBY4253335.1 GntR family transcriptional regulator [Rhodococcus fascians]MBY4268972.1 GntR family transcriptional regulator [Rhodococcus fascians]